MKKQESQGFRCASVKIDVIALFPEIIAPALQTGILKRVHDANILAVNLYNLRDWTTDKHKSVDDYPYGGGAGMILKPEPIFAAVKGLNPERNSACRLSDPAGDTPDPRIRRIAFIGVASYTFVRTLQRRG